MRKVRCHEWIPALWRLTKLRRKENEQILQFESHFTYLDKSQSYNSFTFSFILIMCRIQTDNVILSKWVLKASFMANVVYVHRWCVKRKNGDWLFEAVLVSERQCLWSQASLALAFLAHSMWLRTAGLAGSTEKSRASRCRARCKVLA